LRVYERRQQLLEALDDAYDPVLAALRPKPPHDRVKPLDFSLVRPAEANDSSGGLTRQGIIIGTPERMSPERAEGSDARRAL
jgi:hypothetical protein